MVHIDIESNQNEGGHIPTPSADLTPEAEVTERKEAKEDEAAWKWDEDPSNPYNWPTHLKVQQVLMIASAAFTT